MKNRAILVGFALLLLGNIFSVPDNFFFYIGLGLGIIGLIVVILGSKSKE